MGALSDPIYGRDHAAYTFDDNSRAWVRLPEVLAYASGKCGNWCVIPASFRPWMTAPIVPGIVMFTVVKGGTPALNGFLALQAGYSGLELFKPDEWKKISSKWIKSEWGKMPRRPPMAWRVKQFLKPIITASLALIWPPAIKRAKIQAEFERAYQVE